MLQWIWNIVKLGVSFLFGALFGTLILVGAANRYQDQILERWTYTAVDGVEWSCVRWPGLISPTCEHRDHGQLIYLREGQLEFTPCVISTTKSGADLIR